MRDDTLARQVGWELAALQPSGPGAHGRLSVPQIVAGLGRLARVPWDVPSDAVAPEHTQIELAARCATLASATYGAFTPLAFVQPRRLLSLVAARGRASAAVFESHTGLDRRDVVYARWRSGRFVPPHAICVDHSRRTIFVAVRGTLSIRDCVIDATVAAGPADERAFGPAVHGGAARAARALVRLHHDRLRELLRDYPQYALVLTGHSLGGGVASLAAILLRRALPPRTRRRIRAVALGPLCTLGWDQARRWDHVIDVYVHRDDLIPRLSRGSLRHALEAIRITRAHRRRRDGRAGDAVEHLEPESARRPTRVFGIFGRSRRSGGALSTALLAHYSRPPVATPPPLYPPGRLFHLADSHAGEGRSLRAIGDRRALGVLRVRTHMLRDHWFDRRATLVMPAHKSTFCMRHICVTACMQAARGIH